MVQSSLSAKTLGFCMANLTLEGKQYTKVCLSILPGLCADLILGFDFQKQHQSIIFHHGGPQLPLEVCGFSVLKVEPPDLFANLTSDNHPIAVQRLLKEGIIEPSNSPWRAQVVVTQSENHKRRLVIDYSQTINRFIMLDAYPLPHTDDTVNNIAQYWVFSTINLRSAYHKVKIKDSDKPYTAFQAGKALYQFTRVSFGVTNGVACFQRAMDNIIEQEKLQATFPYLDNITICGKDQNEQDINLKHFVEAASRHEIMYNESVFFPLENW